MGANRMAGLMNHIPEYRESGILRRLESCNDSLAHVSQELRRTLWMRSLSSWGPAAFWGGEI